MLASGHTVARTEASLLGTCSLAMSNTRQLFHALFREQARKSPGAVALYADQQEITYSDLNARSDRIAGRLVQLGVQTGDLVGLYLDRSTDWVVATLGILKANAAVMPLPPAFPAERLKNIFAHASVSRVIDTPAFRLSPALGIEALCLESMQTADVQMIELTDPPSDSPAFVLCSSGSTGHPKMIVRSHESFMHRLNWTWENHPYQEDEVCCQKAQITTTHSIYELFEPLLRGIPVIVISEKTVRDLEAFWQTISDRRISRLLIVPSALHASLQLPGFEPPAIRVMVLMGEYVDTNLAERVLSVFAKTFIYSMYGSTEASSIMVCDLRRSWRKGEDLPLGKAISKEVSLEILDTELQPVPCGEIGQLYVSGSPLFSEYLNDPELTASVLERVVGRPACIYNTYDRVRSTPDGSLQFIGRVDDTVKVRGFRVDLNEVGNALRAQESVSQAAVIVDDGAVGTKSLLAFVTPADVDKTAAFEGLRSLLPEYMIPSTITCLDEFPTTERGKLDKERLIADHLDRRLPAIKVDGLSNTERTIHRVWRTVLGHEDFNCDSSFFEIGGTSLSVFSVVQSLRSEFALPNEALSAQSVYQFPTIDLLAKKIERVVSGDIHDDAGFSPLLVPLKQTQNAELAPLFFIASAGGTVGAYERLANTLTTDRAVIGVRDPFLWGERDPTEGFQAWVGRYIDAIRSHQAHGPYIIGAYSSAGCFGLEIARRLREAGEVVEHLILIDTLLLNRRSRREYGWWALRATYSGRLLRLVVRAAGQLRRLVYRKQLAANDFAFNTDQYEEIRREQLKSKGDLMLLTSLLELNTGLPFSLTESDFTDKAPEQFIDVLKSRFAELMPEVDEDTVENLVVQYSLQARTQHAYQLRDYDCPTHLFEPVSKYSGLVATLLQPHVRDLRTHTLALGPPQSGTRSALLDFGALDPHFRCMRDDHFVRALARKLDQLVN